MPLELSAQFATSLDSPEHIAAAEDLGYHRARLFDVPHRLLSSGLSWRRSLVQI